MVCVITGITLGCQPSQETQKNDVDAREKVRREASRAKYGRRMVVVQTPGRLVINPISVKEFRDADASGKFARMTDFAIRRALRGRNQAVQGKPGRPKKLPRPKG